ncbi:substrate-binding domain-containing protein [Arthrobacter roseus]|uniref:substrate-binding domain-containing protein n=1 Tax=Arthrobacter roseus TaxID=136274 RepID=UPI0019663D84|nr:substrate-binding domain-containing protein [Arthrobacter roseus]MBM7847314.1 Mg-chelatase subunit ChlD [Arthrobacter roseus]
MGRHQTKSRRPLRFWAIVMGVAGVATLTGGMLSTGFLGSFGSCEEPELFTIATENDMASVLHEVTSAQSASECTQFTVIAAGHEATAAKVTEGKETPDLWLADSSTRVRHVSSKTEPVQIANDFAATPAVIVGKKGSLAEPASWLTILQDDDVLLGSPAKTSSGELALLNLLGEAAAGTVDPATVQSLLPLLAQRGAASPPDDVQLMREVADEGGAAVVTEQSWTRFSDDAAASDLAPVVPATGSAFLDYPLVATAGSEDRRASAVEAGKKLTEWLKEDRGQSSLSTAGFRPAKDESLSNDRGVGAVAALKEPAAKNVDEALQALGRAAMPYRSLVVIDVSGSMGTKAGPATRMQLTEKAAAIGSSLFPDNTSMGLWAFSTNRGPNGEDYKELLPIRPLSTKVDSLTQRELLVDGVDNLSSLVGGFTGLYDTTLAAFRTVQAGYDPQSVNSVIILTDGANQDDNSIDLAQLLEALKTEQDPTRPVIVVTLGITEDADAETLKQISAVTGGSSYTAVEPDKIPTVFVDALRARTAK